MKASSARKLGSTLALAASFITMAQACPEPLQAVSAVYGEAVPGTPEFGVTQFITESTTRLLTRAGVRHTVQIVPYARSVKELETGTASVLIIADSAVAHMREQLISVPVLRLQIVRYETATDSASKGTGVTAIMRGFQLPPTSELDESRLQRVANYESMFRMLAAGRVDAAVGVRPTADLYLAQHPEIAKQVRLGRSLDSVLMSIHVSRRLPTACLNLLVQEANNNGPALVRTAFLNRLPSIRFEDFKLP